MPLPENPIHTPVSGGSGNCQKTLTPSFLRKQEPKTLWTEIPAFAGTTGRDKHPSHGLIQRFHRSIDQNTGETSPP